MLSVYMYIYMQGNPHFSTPPPPPLSCTCWTVRSNDAGSWKMTKRGWRMNRMNFFKRKRTKKILFKKEIMKLIIGITKFVESIRSTKFETREVFVNPDARDVRIVLIDISNRAKWSFFFFYRYEPNRFQSIFKRPRVAQLHSFAYLSHRFI